MGISSAKMKNKVIKGSLVALGGVIDSLLKATELYLAFQSDYCIISQRKTIWGVGFKYVMTHYVTAPFFFLFLCEVERCQKNQTSENSGVTRMYAHLLDRRGYGKKREN